MNEVKNEVINQVKEDIKFMSQGSYKMNGTEHYSPVWYELGELANIFNLYDYDFDLDDFDSFLDTEEVMQNEADYWEDPDAISLKVSSKDIKRAKKIYNYLDDNFDDSEILDTYNFETPRPLTRKDIMEVFNKFVKALKQAPINNEMAKKYRDEVQPQSIENYAE